MSREALLDCMRVWAERPGEGLQEILTNRAGLSPRRSAILRRLAAERARSEGDPSRTVLELVRQTGLEGEVATMALEAGTAPLPVAMGGEPGALVSRAPEGRYVLGEEIGRGGLGRVVEATDHAVGRTVALKLLREDAPGMALLRFWREGRITGRLEHPNIVPVHDVGVLCVPRPRARDIAQEGGDSRQVYFAMKRVHGVDMGRVIDELREGRHRGPWNRRRLVEALRDVCRAVAYAHHRGVIHRDLKPANVMLGEFGEVLVVDWGLAKVLGEDDAPRRSASEASGGLTVDGAVLGTPAYMAPEQAAGRVRAMDVRSDVYALGAMLYEVLAWRPPYAGRSAAEVLSRVLAGPPGPPSCVAPAGEAPPPELEAVCLRAMAREPAARYASARDLEGELTAWLEGTKDRERRERDAAEAAAEGDRQRALHEELRAEVGRLEREVRRLSLVIQRFASPEAKGPLWAAEDRLRDTRVRSAEALASADAAYGAALTAVPSHVGARDGRSALHFARYLEAERLKDEEAMVLHRKAIEQSDTGGWTARLEPRGVLAVRAVAYGCGCLAPVRDPLYAPAFEEECLLPWEGGAPAPDREAGPPRPDNRPVPRLLPGSGPSWGHGGACERRPLLGVRLRLHRYQEEGRRLVPRLVRDLGETPLGPVDLPGGSYLCTLEHPDHVPVRLPVRIDRDGTWEQDVTLYRPGEVPEGFVPVPGGPYRSGEEREGVGWREELRTQDLFVSRVPVTVADYVAFLDDLGPEEARRRQPRDGELRFLVEEAGRWRCPRPGEAPHLAPHLDGPLHPVVGVSWLDALAHAAWRSRREGRLYRLMHEDEVEKAARGVDARNFPWGDRYDGSFSNTSISWPEGPHPVPVGGFPVDESPYGVRDMAGNACTWCLNAGPEPHRHYRIFRGGAWCLVPSFAMCAYRGGNLPSSVGRGAGIRLACSPLAAWGPER